MRHKQRIDRFLLDEFFEHMLRHLVVGELRQDVEFELVHRMVAPLLTGELKPIFARNFAHDIDITRSAPRPFQIDSANNFSISVSMLDLEGRAPASLSGA